MSPRRARRSDRLADRWWSSVSPVYDPAVALAGWHRSLDALVFDIASGRVLDVGCGPAYLARGLLERGADYVGVDRNAAMVSRAGRRVRAAAGCAVVVRADVTALPFPEESFDVVVAAAVLGLLDLSSRRTALLEMARVARHEVRLLEPVHRPGAPSRTARSRLVALVRDRPLELAELGDAGLEPRVSGRPVLAGVYSVVLATKH